MTLTSAARGAEIFYMDHDALTGKYFGDAGPLAVSGDIVEGDYDRLLARILNDQDRFIAHNTILLASQAGSVSEALKIASLVRSLFSTVSVGPLTGKCSGPCFLIFSAANQRGTDGERVLGVYRLDSVDEALSESRVPSYLREEMSRHSPADVYWLSSDDEKALGTQSPAFVEYLKAKCAWDPSIEQDVYAGKRPVSDLSRLLSCRQRNTRAEARKTLAGLRRK